MAALALPSIAAALLMTSPALSSPPLIEAALGSCEPALEEARSIRVLEGMPPSGQAAAAPDDSPSEVWASRCASCHAMNGSAKTFMGRRDGARDFTQPAWQDCRSDGDIQAAILRGLAGSRMRSFEAHLTKTQVGGLVKLVRSFDTRLRSEPVAYAK